MVKGRYKLEKDKVHPIKLYIKGEHLQKIKKIALETNTNNSKVIQDILTSYFDK